MTTYPPPTHEGATLTDWYQGLRNLTALDRDDLLALGELVAEAREATLAVFDTYAAAPVIDTCAAPAWVTDDHISAHPCGRTAIDGLCMDHWKGQSDD
jgi:diadenosine tetraphosphate (Ap4A) HIT family hydrolase